MNEGKYAGVDVSKNELSANWGKAKAFRNSPSGIAKLIATLKHNEVTMVVVESTGGYERALVLALYKAEIGVAVINPRRTKAFANSLGLEAKTDTLDGEMLRLFAERMKPQPQTPPSEMVQKLQFLLDRRVQLLNMLVAEKNRRHAPLGCTETKQSIAVVIKLLKKQIRALDIKAAEIIDCNQELKIIADTVQREKGVGPVLTFSLLADLPELGSLSRGQVAALVGVAPFDNQSGTYDGARKTKGGRKKLRTTLYMATVCAIRRNQWLKQHYLSLVKRGKKKKVALVACMRKFIVRLNTLVRELKQKNQAIAFACA